MSQYLYYEFHAIDKPLDEQAQHALRDISSRATVTITSFTNTYNWGDLSADPATMLDRWFDAFLHVANWGARWLAFRLPHGVLSPDGLAPYEGEIFSSRHQGDHSCLHFHLQPEDSQGDWIDGEDLLPAMLPLREALGAGDHRCLYLAWLVDVRCGYWDQDDELNETEPPVPPGLGDLDAAHEAFAEFLDVDRDLLAVAAEMSAPLTPTNATLDTALDWLSEQDDADKNRWLLQVMQGNGARLRWKLRKRMQEDLADTRGAPPPRRTVGELLRRTEEHAETRKRQQARAHAERAERTRTERAAARKLHLDRLMGRESELWRQIDELIDTRKPKPYDQAVMLIADLRDLAERADDGTSWEARVHTLRTVHHRKLAFIRRLDQVRPLSPETTRDKPTS